MPPGRTSSQLFVVPTPFRQCILAVVGPGTDSNSEDVASGCRLIRTLYQFRPLLAAVTTFAEPIRALAVRSLAFEGGRHFRKHLQANRDARFVYNEGGLMNVRADLTRRSHAEPCECPWYLLQHPGEVLPTERLLGGPHRVRSEHHFSGPR